MFYPSYPEFLELTQTHSLLPVSKKVWSDQLTPIRLFKQIKERYCFLLESVEGGQKWARYSFLGNQPFLLFTTHKGQGHLQRFLRDEQGQITAMETEAISDNPLKMLKDLLKRYEMPKHLDLPLFTGGAVGYIGYDAVRLMEELPQHKQFLREEDQIRLMFCDEVIAFDHFQQEITFMSHLRIASDLTNEQKQDVYNDACQRLDTRIKHISTKVKSEDIFDFSQAPQHKPQLSWDDIQSNFSKEEYEQAVEKIKEYIRAGDVFQTVLSQRFQQQIHTDPFNIYRVLRSINPSPYLFYLDLGDDMQIVGSSPERLVRVEEGRVETNPIAGTRPRGQTLEEDLQLANELLADEKERAEHHMLLDLGRNDIGRIAKYGSVEVTKNMEVDKFSHVMHICSTVEGELQEGKDAVDSLFACFPAGTVSGAPKIRAMEIIAQLEKDERHAYSGAIGYFSFSGNHDSCIAIRTIFVRDGQAYVQAGAGIVADSVPEKEWEETCSKARALLVAIQMAEQIFNEQKEGNLHV